MKLITHQESHQAAGGEQYLAITSQYTIEGISESCIESFYQENKSNPALFEFEGIAKKIFIFCNPEPASYNLSTESKIISMALVTLS